MCIGKMVFRLSIINGISLLDIQVFSQEIHSADVNTDKKFMLLYVSAGSGLLTEGEKETFLYEGMSYWSNQSVHITSREAMHVYILFWDTQAKWTQLPLAQQPLLKLIPLWEDLLHLQQGSSFSERCRFNAAAWNLISLLTDDTSYDSIQEAILFMKENVSKVYTIAELATNAGMTPTSFTRAFKKKTGISPKEFLNEQRIKLAKELMQQHENITTKDIALQVGLQDEFYFSRLFKKKEGIPPSVYMKKFHERRA
jgi:AraC-like DNA-binding protein